MKYQKPDFKCVGFLMRGLREARGMSIWDLAFKSGVSESNIWRLEHGLLMGQYHINEFFALCDALDAEPYLVLRLAGKKKGKP